MRKIRAHCYGCGATTPVAVETMASDLARAGWIDSHGQTFCPSCAAKRGLASSTAPPVPLQHTGLAAASGAPTVTDEDPVKALDRRFAEALPNPVLRFLVGLVGVVAVFMALMLVIAAILALVHSPPQTAAAVVIPILLVLWAHGRHRPSRYLAKPDYYDPFSESPLARAQRFILRAIPFPFNWIISFGIAFGGALLLLKALVALGQSGFWIALEILAVLALAWGWQGYKKAQAGGSPPQVMSRIRSAVTMGALWVVLITVRLVTHSY